MYMEFCFLDLATEATLHAKVCGEEDEEGTTLGGGTEEEGHCQQNAEGCDDGGMQPLEEKPNESADSPNEGQQ